VDKQDQKTAFVLKLINYFNHLLDTCITAGYFDERTIRNFRLKLRYNQLLFSSNIKAREAREIISDEFYLGDEAIQKIIYSKGKKRNVLM
jgi:hypothetical protein